MKLFTSRGIGTDDDKGMTSDSLGSDLRYKNKSHTPRDLLFQTPCISGKTKGQSSVDTKKSRGTME